MAQILQIIGANIRHYRKQVGLSQEKLAELAGLHRNYVGAVERAENNISATNIARLAEVLEIEPHELLKARKTTGN